MIILLYNILTKKWHVDYYYLKWKKTDKVTFLLVFNKYFKIAF